MEQLFENDIFISYAHIDDLALAEGEKGWVSNFHHALDIRLRQLIGGEARIWRDAKLQGNDYFSDALVNKFPGVALVVSVLSPRYIQSEWCLREVDEFLKSAESGLGLRLGEKLRLFKVVKTPVPLEKQPEVMQGVLGYEFYQVDSATGRPREFSQEVGAYKDPRYWDKLEDLAYEVADLLQSLRQQGADQVTPVASKLALYLAPTTSDLKTEYDMIKREFQQRGHPVLPDRPLALNAPELQEQVREDLNKCRLSVHLIGKNYGLIPEASEHSVIDLQNQIAAEHSNTPGFSRIIWMPKGLQAEEPRQQAFIRSLEIDADAQRGADLLKTDLGELKGCIQALLSDTPKPKIDMDAEDDAPQVYMIYSPEDVDEAAVLEDALFDAGCEVISPLIEGDDEEMLEDYQENLLHCDAALVYYGQAGDRWFRTKLRDLSEIDARRERPLRAKAVYLAAPENRQKQRFQTRRVLVMKHFERFSSSHLQPFMAAINLTTSH